jgi:ParB-like chromosome segregation protein Spo0J
MSNPQDQSITNDPAEDDRDSRCASNAEGECHQLDRQDSDPADTVTLPSAAPPAIDVIAVPLTSVLVGPRLRQLREDHIATLKKSIELLGVLQPISIAKAVADDDSEPLKNSFILVAGLHRLEACKSLGHSEVPAIVVTLGDEQRRLWEIDENLFRAPLTELERGEHLVERKEIYERLHPGAAHGGNRRGADFKRKNLPLESFAADTAKQIGCDARTIRLSIERALNIDPKVRDRIRGRREIADKGIELDALKSLSPEGQDRAVKLIEDGTCKSVRDALQTMADMRAQDTDQNRSLGDESQDTAVPSEAGDATSPNPREQGIINDIHKILHTLDEMCRADLVSNISKLGNMAATNIAKYLM